MKRGVLLALTVLAAGLLAFGITRYFGPSAPAEMTDEIAWMRSEFHLTAEQAAAVEKLHDDYFPVCMEHCRLVARARKTLAAASADERPSAQAELARLQSVCETATREHLRRVAAAMPPAEGERFLALVLPKLTHLEHNAPLGLK